MKTVEQCYFCGESLLVEADVKTVAQMDAARDSILMEHLFQQHGYLMKALQSMIDIGAVDEQYRDITRSGESHEGVVTGVDGSTHRGEG